MSDREAMKLALKDVEAALNAAYDRMFPVCCGKASLSGCCGQPEQAWTPQDEALMSLLAPVERTLRTHLAAPRPEPSGYAYRYADGVLRLNDGSQFNGGWPVEAVPYWFAPPAAAPEPTHPGYVIGSHWLETAYSRICAGEAEADVLRDCGWERVTDAEALRREDV